MIYLASSWKNKYHNIVLESLREAGFDVYNYRHDGFNWGCVTMDPIETWSNSKWAEVLSHPKADEGFERDMRFLNAAETVILLMPSGNSAHMELGYACARRLQNTCVLVMPGEPPAPDLMHKMTTGGLIFGIPKLLEWLKTIY